MTDSGLHQWTLVIPVKQAVLAKSRLMVSGIDKEALARAFALDTIEAAAASDHVAQVVVVTADALTAVALEAIGRVIVLKDTASDLRGAIELGLAAVGDAKPRGVLLGDLPALQSWQLSQALATATSVDRAFVPDADQTGTSLATARAWLPLPCLFGPDSAADYRSAEFVEIMLPSSSGLRQDVDTAEHLVLAQQLGLGPRSRAMLN